MTNRIERIAGQPIKAYDSGPNRGADRYTVVYVADWRHESSCGCGEAGCKKCYGSRLYGFIGMNANPYHPTFGIAQHGECRIGRHLGRRIPFAALPEDCRQIVIRECGAAGGNT